MRRIGRHKRKKQKRLIIITSLSLLLFLCVGYAAFGTSLTLKAKGNIKSKKAADMLKEKVVDSGDGLYKDIYENGRYIYKGSNPDNYITFNNEMWRIISVEADGTIKILKNNLLSNRAWDTTGGTYGLSNWARPADLNTYLNGEYYNGFNSSIKDNIVSHTWGIGVSSFEDNKEGKIDKLIEDEKGITWSGNVGLISLSDYLLANSDVANCESLINFNVNYETCRNTNWMYIDGSDWWMITPGIDDRERVFYVSKVGDFHYLVAYYSDFAPRPAAYLRSDITISGSGTVSDPFTIV